ncbi:MAG: transposase [Acidobacteriota bacterium]|nr:transposase [Acidobacteriota bacterium]
MTDENLAPPHYKRGRRLTHHPMIVRRLHLPVSRRGVIVNAVLTPGNWDDRDAATALVQAVSSGSVGLGDRGYRRPSVQAELLEEDGVLLLTRAEANEEQQALLGSVRERVETTFSQLWTRYATRVYARSWHGLWTKASSCLRVSMPSETQ